MSGIILRSGYYEEPAHEDQKSERWKDRVESAL
jgi:hypothetical protein